MDQNLNISNFFREKFSRLMTIHIFFLYFFLRDRNGQHFNEDLLAVNTSAFSFVLCFKTIDYAEAFHYVISAN